MMDAQGLAGAMGAVAGKIEENKEYLTRLDQLNGDGDLGISMSEGFKAVDMLLEMSEESYDRVMEINAKGTMFMTQAVARQMMAQEQTGAKRGTIVNVSSCSCEVVSLNRGEYCISKAGISMVTKLFAARLAPEGILVFEVRPGVIATDMTSTVEDKYNHLIEEGVFPIARWGRPEDVADAVSVFAGEKFLYSTGNYIDVDGGFHIRRL